MPLRIDKIINKLGVATYRLHGEVLSRPLPCGSLSGASFGLRFKLASKVLLRG